MFRGSMAEIEETKKIPTVHYVTSLSTPNFEDPAIIKMVAEHSGQAVGMSYSAEKQVLSGLNNIGRFIGISIITNIQELIFKEDIRVADQCLIISVEEMKKHRAWEFTKKYTSTDEEVRENGKLAEMKLSMAISQLVKNLPSLRAKPHVL